MYLINHLPLSQCQPTTISVASNWSGWLAFIMTIKEGSKEIATSGPMAMYAPAILYTVSLNVGVLPDRICIYNVICTWTIIYYGHTTPWSIGLLFVYVYNYIWLWPQQQTGWLQVKVYITGDLCGSKVIKLANEKLVNYAVLGWSWEIWGDVCCMNVVLQSLGQVQWIHYGINSLCFVIVHLPCVTHH